MNVLRPALLSLALLAAPHLAQGANDLPSLGDASSSIVSPEQEFQMGRAWLSMLRGQVPAINDPQLKQFVEQTVYKLAETSDLQDHRLVFILIKDPEINAFAAPGGVIGSMAGCSSSRRPKPSTRRSWPMSWVTSSSATSPAGWKTSSAMQLPLMAALLAGIVAARAGGGDAGIAAIASTQAAAIQSQLRFFPTQRAGGRPRRHRQSGARRLRSARHAGDVRSARPAVSL